MKNKLKSSAIIQYVCDCAFNLKKQNTTNKIQLEPHLGPFTSGFQSVGRAKCSNCGAFMCEIWKM